MRYAMLVMVIAALGACKAGSAEDACEDLCDVGNECRALTQPAPTESCCGADDLCGLGDDGSCQCPDAAWDRVDCDAVSVDCVRGCLAKVDQYELSPCRDAQARALVCQSDFACGLEAGCESEMDLAARRCVNEPGPSDPGVDGGPVDDTGGGDSDGGGDTDLIGDPGTVDPGDPGFDGGDPSGPSGDPDIPAVCTVNSQGCADEQRVWCPDGTGWDVLESCTAQERCRSDGTHSWCEADQAPVCTYGDVYCNGASLYRCTSAGWELADVCALGCVDDGDGGVSCREAECSLGESRCYDDYLQECQNGQWSAVEDCMDRIDGYCYPYGSEGPVCVGDVIGDSGDACELYASRCSPNQPDVVELCSNDGTWTPWEQCPSGYHCVDNGGINCVVTQ